MYYKFLITVFITMVVHRGFSQTAIQQGEMEARKLSIYFSLSSQQEDSLKAALPGYYTAKANLLQLSTRTAADTRNLQALHDDIMKRIFTTEQYLRYDSVKLQHIQLMKQRTDSIRNQ